MEVSLKRVVEVYGTDSEDWNRAFNEDYEQQVRRLWRELEDPTRS